MKNIAIIPARGGSKRIPKKNIKDFFGKPIIYYSISTCIESGLFDEVMVSTDDPEIAEASLKCGASVPFLRSQKNSDDFASTSDVLLEVITEYENQNKIFDFCCCIYATAPLVTAKILQESYGILLKSNADSLIPIVKYSYPIQRSLKIENERVKFVWEKNSESRSQDLEDYYHDAGQFYWAKLESFMREKSLLTKNTLPFLIQEIDTQDIDNEMDWKMAELKYKLLNE
jgi:N-acylneuraminate cytidylyltransferase